MEKLVRVNWMKGIKDLKHFTKINENTWLIQKDKNSKCESYYVSVLPCAIVMYGDYDGVIVRPNECKEEALIHWMANATTPSYFVEKVIHANQHHQCEEYSQKRAEEIIIDIVYDYAGMESKKFKKYIEEVINGFNVVDEEILKDKLKGNSFDEDDLKKHLKILEEIENKSLCEREDYQDLISTFEGDFDMCDLWEYKPTEYTFRIRWQHHCLLWWARHILKNKGG